MVLLNNFSPSRLPCSCSCMISLSQASQRTVYECDFIQGQFCQRLQLLSCCSDFSCWLGTKLCSSVSHILDTMRWLFGWCRCSRKYSAHHQKRCLYQALPRHCLHSWHEIGTHSILTTQCSSSSRGRVRACLRLRSGCVQKASVWGTDDSNGTKHHSEKQNA